eukprot:3255924-Pleurochrysis_carterae.AAC.1
MTLDFDELKSQVVTCASAVHGKRQHKNERLAHRADGHSERLIAVCEQKATAEAKVGATTTKQMTSIIVARAEHAQTWVGTPTSSSEETSKSGCRRVNEGRGGCGRKSHVDRNLRATT